MKVLKRDDPVSNANVLAILIFMIVVQKYLVDYMTSGRVSVFENPAQIMIVCRQTILAIELLFIQIPVRHNFSVDNVEL